MESIGDALDQFVDQAGIREKVESVRLEEEWSRILDPPLSDNLTVGSFEDGHLLLIASDPSWSQEATYQKEAIRSEINEYFDREFVESIRVKN